MRTWTLGDREVQTAIKHFIHEARIAARTPREDEEGVLGFAAMSTIFPCVLALGEALLGPPPTERNRWSDREIIRTFCDEMQDTDSWFLLPQDAPQDDTRISEILCAVRNGLAHALCMPFEVVLLPHGNAVEHSAANTYRIIVPAFIDAVEETIAEVTDQRGSLSMDRVISPQRDRGLVDTQALPNAEERQIRMRNTIVQHLLQSSAGTASGSVDINEGRAGPDRG